MSAALIPILFVLAGIILGQLVTHFDPRWIAKRGGGKWRRRDESEEEE